MAKNLDTLAKTADRELTHSKDGGWVLGGSLRDFSVGKHVAYARSEKERRAAERQGVLRANRAQQAREGTAVVDMVDFVGGDNVSYDMRAKDLNRGTGGLTSWNPVPSTDAPRGEVTVQVKNPEYGIHEAGHVRAYDLTNRTPEDTSYYQYLSSRNEVLARMGSMVGWAFSKDGGNHTLMGADVGKFWNDILMRHKASGQSVDDFVNGLDMPKDGREVIKAYIEDKPGIRDAYSDVKTWDLVAQNGSKDDMGTMAAEKGGRDLRQMASFLATDEVPETLFGIPVVTREDQYTNADLKFFKEHPEAGGYYDMGDEDDGVTQEVANGGDTQEVANGDTQEVANDGVTQEVANGDAYADRAIAAMQDVLPFTKAHEGFRENAYQDSQGVWTVGYGQTTINGRPVEEGDTISEEDASAFVWHRIRENAYSMYKRYPWMEQLSQNALAAAYDLAYNLGEGIFTEGNSPGFNRRLAAGEDPEEVLWSEYGTYLGGENATEQTREGLRNRRDDAIERWGN